MDAFTLTIAVEHNVDVFYSILQFLLPHRPERTRELWRNGGKPTPEIDTAACLEALRCCNKRWKAFFAGVLPDGHYLWRQLLKQLHIGRHGPALVRFVDLVNAHTENTNYKERFWLALKKPYEYVTKPLVLSMFRLLARRAEEALRDGVPFSKKFDNEARGCSHALVWTLQSSADPRGQETRAELLIEFEASLKTLKLRYIDPLERGTRGRAAAVESLAGYGTRMARIPLHAAKVSVRALEIRGEVLGDEAPHPDALPG